MWYVKKHGEDVCVIVASGVMDYRLSVIMTEKTLTEGSPCVGERYKGELHAVA